MSKDLLREAIADAKAVKETAFANAKMALEEALAPHIQSMISAKLSEEMGDDDEKKEESVRAEGEEYGTDDMKKVKDLKEEEEDDDKKEKMKEEAEDSEKENEKLKEEDEEEMEEDLDLEAIIRELEEELASSEIGRGENKEPSDDASYASTEDPGSGDHVKHDTPKMMEEEGDEEAAVEGSEMHDKEEMHDKKELNIEDIINALRELTEEEGEEEDEEEAKTEYGHKMESLQSDLKEAYDVISFLRTQINEVNLLNAKLLYSNKLFKKYDLNEAQKGKVIDNFDRAKSVREVKLVFTTLAEAFRGNKTKPLTIKESFVSNAMPSTKPSEKTKEIISESDMVVERFQKLAGLK